MCCSFVVVVVVVFTRRTCESLKRSSRSLKPIPAVKLLFFNQSGTIFTWRARVFPRLASDANNVAGELVGNPHVF